MDSHPEKSGPLSTLIRLYGEVLSAPTLEGMYCRIADSVRLLTGAQVGLSAPMGPEGRFRTGGAVSMFRGQAVYFSPERFRIEPDLDRLFGRLADRLTARWPEEALMELPTPAGAPEGNPATRGVLGARLVDEGGRGSGIILLSCKEAGEFSAEDEGLLGHFAALVSWGLQQAAFRQEVLMHQDRLRRNQDELEMTLSRRTVALSKINRALKEEVLERKKAEEQIKSYHDQLRFLASELSLSEERERRRIAVAIHDHVSQNLAAAKIKLQMLRADALPQMAASLEDIQKFIDSSIHDARSITMELSPPVLYELGLIPALEWLAESMQLKHGIEIAFEGDGLLPSELDGNIQALLFQMTRELLWNVVKHARARHVRLCLKTVRSAELRDAKKIQIRVEDDGIGFDPVGLRGRAEKESGSFGLFSIRERLKPLGGSMLMESAPGQGTRAVIELLIQSSASS